MAKKKNSNVVQTNAGPNPMGPSKQPTVNQAIRQLAAGGITKQELTSLVDQTGKSAQQLVQQMDKINKNVRQAGGTPSIALNSGAANMLIKQMEKATPQMLGYQQPDFGTGQIGKTLQSMMVTPGSPGVMIKGQLVGGRAAQPGFNPGGNPNKNRMIVGTAIRPGGNIGMRPMGAAPAVGDTNVTGGGGDQGGGDQGGGDQGGGDQGGGDQFDYQSILDAIAGIQQPSFDMSALTDMFNTQFDQLSSQFDQLDPLRLAQLGRAYGGDAIRARQNIRKTRQDYRRGLPSMALGQALANLSIGGGLTL